MSSNVSVCRFCRQAGEKLFLKGARCRTNKCAMEKRSTAPGQHGKRFGGEQNLATGAIFHAFQQLQVLFELAAIDRKVGCRIFIRFHEVECSRRGEKRKPRNTRKPQKLGC